MSKNCLMNFPYKKWIMFFVDDEDHQFSGKPPSLNIAGQKIAYIIQFGIDGNQGRKNSKSFP